MIRMNESRGTPLLKLANTSPGPKEVKFERCHASARFGRGFKLPGAEDILRSCAMVDVALDKNVEIRPIWIEIMRSWDRPGCTAYTALWTQGSHELETLILYAEKKGEIFDTKPNPESVLKAFEEIAEAYNKLLPTFKQDADISHLNTLIEKFIVKAFNGPIDPILRPVLGRVEYMRAPKYKIKVKPENVKPCLRHAIAFLSWCDSEGINLREVDRERMGIDYKVVTSGKKPTSQYGRDRKREINEDKRKLGLSFISDKSIYSGAEKWYDAMVVLGSLADAASEYEIEHRQTLQNEIKPYNHIAGLC